MGDIDIIDCLFVKNKQRIEHQTPIGIPDRLSPKPTDPGVPS